MMDYNEGNNSKQETSSMKKLVIACPIAIILAVSSLGGYLGWRHWNATRHWQAAQEAEAQRHFAQAEQHLEYCRKAWPRDAKVYLASARVARRAGQFDDPLVPIAQPTNSTVAPRTKHLEDDREFLNRAKK